MEVEDNSAVGDLSAAWDEVEAKETDNGNNGEQEVQQSSGSSAEAEHSDSTELSAEGSDTTADNTAVSGGDEEAGTTETAESSTPVPVGLPAEAREAWATTPKAMQEAIIKRERDFAVGIQKYAETAKRAVQMDSALQPFQQYFAMNGGDPGRQITNLLQTASLLQMGSPQQRAQAAADIIKQFGVDIDSLDRILVGEPLDPRVQTQSVVQQEIDRALAPYKQREQEEQQRQQEQQSNLYATIDNELEAFAKNPKNEFYRDVREDMADILDLAANRGQRMSLDEAYRRACIINTEVQGRVAAKNKAALEAKKKAASSVSGGPGGPGSQGKIPDDVRGALEMAWDMAGTN